MQPDYRERIIRASKIGVRRHRVMDPQTTLSTAAEVGIGIAGFSTIAATFAHGRNHANPAATWALLRRLLQSSAIVVLFCYLPMVLSATGIHENHIWRLASCVYIAWLVLVGFQVSPNKNIKLITYGFGAVSFGLNIYNVVFVTTAWPYLAALSSGLFIAFANFYTLIRQLIVPPNTPGDS